MCYSRFRGEVLALKKSHRPTIQVIPGVTQFDDSTLDIL